MPLQPKRALSHSYNSWFMMMIIINIIIDKLVYVSQVTIISMPARAHSVKWLFIPIIFTWLNCNCMLIILVSLLCDCLPDILYKFFFSLFIFSSCSPSLLLSSAVTFKIQWSRRIAPIMGSFIFTLNERERQRRWYGACNNKLSNNNIDRIDSLHKPTIYIYEYI